MLAAAHHFAPANRRSMVPAHETRSHQINGLGLGRQCECQLLQQELLILVGLNRHPPPSQRQTSAAL
jgi:hypothetical protein